MSQPNIEVTPVDAAVDVRRSVRLSGFTAGPVTLVATLSHPDGSTWHSTAQFVLDETGIVDLDIQAPQQGDWDTPDAMATVWAMRRQSLPTELELSEETNALTIQLSASNDRGEKAQTQFIQRFIVDGVTRREIAEAQIVGTLFTPATPGPHPAIIVMNGSGGGIPRQRAALYAARGYQALALGYFKAPGLPDTIGDMPLEYFERALDWVHRELKPADGFVAITGQSRGGELSLLLASRFPEKISATIAYVPSSVIHGTLRAGFAGQAPDSSVWTWQGKPLPNVWQNNPDVDWSAFDQRPEDGRPVRQEPAFHTPMRNAAAVAAARIPVEQIRGPVMLISGTDDGFWPSSWYSEQIEQTLREHQHAWPVEHVRCEGAGHAIGVPNLPATLIAKPHPVGKVVLSGGGTAAANATANRVSWARVHEFLAQARQARHEASGNKGQ
ncbi:acyl-CoA thioesterase/bile acid-CoA:amino acid N-acyltransferase family protein [Bordetella sp. 02P26C-1]|uniref:acyl-CoA thioesterase/bile acid-CoA:amino acid N-acyltransferase family protein n=1 Tax=Bordetella sp. 02P26C-1 TaxID=2683195 RepID=UPI001353F421|nr:acyl-CoA thioesterase/bile acid-CoA:amino acid N-acyltransferase family protein [Bordetella sp. 02P26C-1]MVW77320.1 acyl-CoA thioester hydrolase [Bordetella sp. 02P26C-1]